MRQQVLLVSIFLASNALGVDLESIRNTYEREISTEIQDSLKDILPDNKYRILSSVALAHAKREFKQEIKAVEKTKKKGPKKESPPGFEPLHVDSDEDNIETTSHTHYEPLPSIESVHVIFLVDNNVSTDKRDIAASIIKKRIVVSFGSSSTFEMKGTSFEDLTPSIHSLARDQVREKLGLLMILASILAVGSLLILLFYLMHCLRTMQLERVRKRAEARPKITDLAPKSLAQNPLLDGSIARIVEFIAKDPVVFRDFYQALPQRAQDVFAQSLDDTPFKDLVKEIANIEFKQDYGDIEDDEKSAEMKKILSFIEQFKKLHLVMRERAFGFLESFSPERLTHFLSGRSLEDTAIILNNLEQRYAREVLKGLPPQVKAGILSLATHADRVSKLEGRTKELEKSLRDEFSDIRIHFSPITDRTIVELMVENDTALKGSCRNSSLRNM